MHMMKSLIDQARSQLEDATSSVRSHFQDRADTTDATMARGLGLASIVIGLIEILLPRQLERTMGLGNGENTGIFRVLGVREIGHALAILSEDDPTPGVYSRLIGDALDGVLLAKAAARTRNPSGFATIAAMTMGVVAADVILAGRLARK